MGNTGKFVKGWLGFHKVIRYFEQIFSISDKEFVILTEKSSNKDLPD